MENSYHSSNPLSSHGIPPSRTPSLSPPPSRTVSRSASTTLPSENYTSFKSAVILGAHTELGKLVLLNLLRHPLISRIHALVSVDPRGDIPIHPDHFPKLRLVLDSLDNIDQIMKTKVPPVQLAFCCLGSSKQDHSRLGPYTFRKLNYDIPRRFVYHLFRTDVQRIGILSHAQANIAARTEFLKVKGELVHNVIQLLRQAGRHAPSVLLLRVPLLLTNLKDTNGLHGYKIPRLNEIKQKAALKFEMGPSQAVHVRDVAKAMVADVILYADLPPESDLAFRFRKHQYRLTELYGPDIVNLANEVRMAQRRLLSERLMGEQDDIPQYEHEPPPQEIGFPERQPWLSGERMDPVPDQVAGHADYAGVEYPNRYGNNIMGDPRVERGEYMEDGVFYSAGANEHEGESIDVAGEPVVDRNKEFEAAIGSVEALAYHLGRHVGMEDEEAGGWNQEHNRRRVRVNDRVWRRMEQTDWLDEGMGERFTPEEAERWRRNDGLNIRHTPVEGVQGEDGAYWPVKQRDGAREEKEDALQRRSGLLGNVGVKYPKTDPRYLASARAYVNSTDSLTSPTKGVQPSREKSMSVALGHGEVNVLGGERSEEDGGAISGEYQPSREMNGPYSYHETEQWVASGNDVMERRSTSPYADTREGSITETPAEGSGWRGHGGAGKSFPNAWGLEKLGAFVEKVIAATDRPSRKVVERSGRAQAQRRRNDIQDQEFLIDDFRGNGDMRAAGQISI